MFRLIATAVLALGLSSAATQANARASYGEDLRFVADTLVTDGGTAVAVCHLVDYMDILFIPVYTTAMSYALSQDGCAGEAYAPLTNAEFSDLQVAGVIPANLPAEPSLGFAKMAWGHAWIILGVIAIFKVALMRVFGGKARRKAGTPDMLAIHSLVAMSQVAVADGHIDQREVQQIANILTRLTGNSYAPAQVMDLLGKLNPSPSDLDQIGQDLSEKDRQIVLEAALNIAVADGEIHPSEYAVVSDLAMRMRIGADQFRSAMARISAHLNTAPAV